LLELPYNFNNLLLLMHYNLLQHTCNLQPTLPHLKPAAAHALQHMHYNLLLPALQPAAAAHALQHTCTATHS
ncbi:hypothetical protein, partial [Bosea sp. (in: a-proteobacteria)]|uniref:hypothetical protein n=1 Tax=Bosea sp. (in: a-proteobacteria) TaxID=1871050 RepID=UPI0040337C40